MIIAPAFFSVINSFLFVIYSLFTPAPSTATPITFNDAKNVNMAFVTYADPQVLPFGYHQVYLEKGFEDIENSGLDFDAFVVAGDLTELSDLISYNIYWDAMEKSGMNNIILATGT